MSSIDLADEQVRAIQKWAAATPEVREVRLFGSRARGTARVDSDVDLAVTVNESTLGDYVALANRWGKHLSQATRLDVRLKQYNSVESERIRRWCDEFSIILFPVENYQAFSYNPLTRPKTRLPEAAPFDAP
jgi:predicted nucleotidyltransferase